MLPVEQTFTASSPLISQAMCVTKPRVIKLVEHLKKKGHRHTLSFEQHEEYKKREGQNQHKSTEVLCPNCWHRYILERATAPNETAAAAPITGETGYLNALIFLYRSTLEELKVSRVLRFENPTLHSLFVYSDVISTTRQYPSSECGVYRCQRCSLFFVVHWTE